MAIRKTTIAPIIKDQLAIEELSYEMEKVLQYYAEHPQYPLDYAKIRNTMQEVNSRMTKVREELQHMSGLVKA